MNFLLCDFFLCLDSLPLNTPFLKRVLVNYMQKKKKKKGLEKYEHDIHSAASLFRAPN